MGTRVSPLMDRDELHRERGIQEVLQHSAGSVELIRSWHR